MATKDILVIANDRVFQILLKICLEKEPGFSIIKTTSGQRGIIKAEIYQPDAILLDTQSSLKILNILEKLKVNPKTESIPVILLMSKIQQTQMFQLERDEAAGIITRPFDGLTLDSQIREILDWQVEKKIPQSLNIDFCNE